MCGIAGIYLKDPAVVKAHAGLERMVDELLLGCEKRGKQATGFVAVTGDNKATIDKADVTASEFILNRERLPQDSRIILLHTRFATKGSTDDHRNNHPVIHGTCFTVHNGSVNNDDDLFEKHGFNRIAEVDSEIIPALMGKANFDPKAVDDLFYEVEGPVASATIDPINHPGKVMLVKTTGSPLHLIETDKFLIWASEGQTIRDAWGKVLGTPPAWKRVKFVGERKMIEVTAEGTKVYDMKKPPVKHAQSWTVVPRKDEKKDEQKDTDSGKDNTGWNSLVTAAEVRAAVVAARKRGDALAVTRVLTGVTGTRWEYCNICMDMVRPQDMVQTLQRGRMCIDCSAWWNRLYEMKATVSGVADEEEDDDTVDEFGVPVFVKTLNYIQAHRINELNRWSEDEDHVHMSVMDTIAEATGIQSEALNFMLFRMDVKTVKDNPKFSDLMTLLWDMYDKLYDGHWRKHDANYSADYKRILGRQVYAMPPADEGDRQKHPLIVNKAQHTRAGKCLFCARTKTKRILPPASEVDFGYCNRHWNTCSYRGCNNKANHTRREGIRVCHSHARGNSGCHSDTTLTKKGYKMEAVK